MAATSTDEVWELSEGSCYVALTYDHLNAQEIMNRVRSSEAGAIVLFAGKSLTPTSKYIHAHAENDHSNNHQARQEIVSQESQ
jgi:molybdopterin synthase catalytic subunit